MCFLGLVWVGWLVWNGCLCCLLVVCFVGLFCYLILFVWFDSMDFGCFCCFLWDCWLGLLDWLVSGLWFCLLFCYFLLFEYCVWSVVFMLSSWGCCVLEFCGFVTILLCFWAVCLLVDYLGWLFDWLLVIYVFCRLAVSWLVCYFLVVGCGFGGWLLAGCLRWVVVYVVLCLFCWLFCWLVVLG